MKLDLEQFTYEELRSLNDLIVQRLKYLERARTADALARFRIGERVSPQFLRKPGDSDKVGNIVELKPK